METGITAEQIEAWKRRFENWTGTPQKFRLLVCGVLFLAAYFGVISPLVNRVAQAKVRLGEAEATEKKAQNVLAMRESTQTYSDRVMVSADGGAFRDYVVAMVREVGLRVNTLAVRSTEEMVPFQAVTLALEAEGTYPKILDFIDRAERGRVFLRLDNLELERAGDVISFECLLVGMMKFDG